MSRAAISGLVCTTFLMFLGSSAVPQEPERKGADTESGQLTFNNAWRADIGRGPRQGNCILGVAHYQLSSIRHSTHAESIFLYALDLIELSGDDLRRDPLEVRKATLASIVAKASPGIRFNEHIEGDGPTVFAHACKLGLG